MSKREGNPIVSWKFYLVVMSNARWNHEYTFVENTFVLCFFYLWHKHIPGAFGICNNLISMVNQSMMCVIRDNFSILGEIPLNDSFRVSISDK